MPVNLIIRDAECRQVGFEPSVITASTPYVTIYSSGTNCSSTQEKYLLSTLKREDIPVSMLGGTITITADGKFS